MADLDGLRGIAILSVLAFHLFPRHFSLGFLGVDIFFVISGFLIMRILLVSETKFSSLLTFYQRRILRVFPATILTLICTAIGGFFLLPDGPFNNLLKDTISAGLFIINFNLIDTVGYFTVAALTKPLLHLWSLSIEEQFYLLIAPTILLFGFGTRTKISLVWFIFVSSLIYSVLLADKNTNDVFYHSYSRAWELCAGALLAVHEPRLRKLAFELENRDLITAGMVTIILLTVAQYSVPRFDGPAIRMPAVMFSAFVILKALNAKKSSNFLSKGCLAFLGKISFSLYLVHWPLLSFFEEVGYGKVTGGFNSVVIGLISIFISYMSFKFVETPVRRTINAKFWAISLLAVMGLVTASSLYALNSGFSEERALKEPDRVNFYTNHFNYSAENMISEDCTKVMGPEFSQFCVTKDAIEADEVFIFGDSIANALFYGFSEKTENIRIHNVGRGACLPVLGLETRIEFYHPNQTSYFVGCSNIAKRSVEYATSAQPKIIIMSAMWSAFATGERSRSIAGSTYELYKDNLTALDDSNTETILKQLKATIRLLPADSLILIVDHPPRLNFDPISCWFRYTANHKIFKSSLSEHCSMPQKSVEREFELFTYIAHSLEKEFRNVRGVSLSDMFCDGSQCSMAPNDTPLYRDDVHLGYEGSLLAYEKIATIIKEQIAVDRTD